MKIVNNKKFILWLIVILLAIWTLNFIINIKYGEIKRKNNQRNVSSITENDIVYMAIRNAFFESSIPNTIINKDDIEYKEIMNIIGEIKNLKEYNGASNGPSSDRKGYIVFIKTNKKPPLDYFQLQISDDYIIGFSYKERPHFLNDILGYGRYYRFDNYFIANEKIKENIKRLLTNLNKVR